MSTKPFNRTFKFSLFIIIAVLAVLMLKACGGGGGGTTPPAGGTKFTISDTADAGVTDSTIALSGTCPTQSKSISAGDSAAATTLKTGTCNLSVTIPGQTTACTVTIPQGGITPDVVGQLNKCKGMDGDKLSATYDKSSTTLIFKFAAGVTPPAPPATKGAFTFINNTGKAITIGGKSSDTCFNNEKPTSIINNKSAAITYKPAVTKSCETTLTIGTQSCELLINNIDTTASTPTATLDLKNLYSACAAFNESETLKAKTYDPVKYRGVSLAGGAFNGAIKNLEMLPVKGDAKLFIMKGANTFRVPIAWEYLISDAPCDSKSTSFQLDPNTKYFKRIKETITKLTAEGAFVILDLHNYMRFNRCTPGKDVKSGADTIIGGSNMSPSTPTSANLGTLWHDLAKQFDNNSHVLYELMNEPHDLGTNEILTTNYNLAIGNIRTAESEDNIKQPHTIILDGTGWSGLHNFYMMNMYNVVKDEASKKVTVGTKDDWLTKITPNTNIMLDVHQYVDYNKTKGEYFSGQNKTCPAVDSNLDDDMSKLITTGLPTKYHDVFKKPFQPTGTDASVVDLWLANMDQYSIDHKGIPYIVGEFGGYYPSDAEGQKVPASQTCVTNMKSLLSGMQTSKSPYLQGYVWWAAGHGFNSEYPLYISPGACHGNQYFYPGTSTKTKTMNSQWTLNPFDDKYETGFYITNASTTAGIGTFSTGLPDETAGADKFTISVPSGNYGPIMGTPANIGIPSHGYYEGYPIDYSQATCNTLQPGKPAKTVVIPSGIDPSTAKDKKPQPNKIQYGIWGTPDFMVESYDIGFTGPSDNSKSIYGFSYLTTSSTQIKCQNYKNASMTGMTAPANGPLTCTVNGTGCHPVQAGDTVTINPGNYHGTTPTSCTPPT